ncbi:MAG TPA: bacitracin ABC transporter ATP-binding protein [Firmicutes bacterium]|nr:bacitracin ABC transporter ATP-binding protein [Bacillota bacterium]
METILETNNLEKKYKDFKALNHTNIHIEKGAIYGLIGKNGAGKTTLIRIICGLQEPTNGTYTIYGVDNKSSNIASVRERMGAIIETPSIYGEMTARDNLIEQYKLVGMPEYDGIDDLLKLVGLENTGKKKAKNFSLGMKQRLGIAIALASHPDFLILDEPINGLDPTGIIEIRELILNLNKKNNITILISSHYLDELSKIATHYGFLDNGTLIKEISSEELMKKMEHKIELKVNYQKDFVKYFETNGINYEVVDKETINVYGEQNLSKFIAKLTKNNLEAEEIHEYEESLENYFINLIEGVKND